MRAPSPPCSTEDVDALGRACVTWMLRGVPGSRTLPGIRPSLADLRRPLRRLVQRRVASPLGRRSRRHAAARGGRTPRREGRRALLPGAGGRRRGQGPRRPEERRRVGVFRFGRRVLRRQDRTRIRPPRSRCSAPTITATSRGSATRSRPSACPQERFEAILYQLVFITKGGEAVKSSKRAGNFVTIDEVMDEIDEAAQRKGAGADALRFFFLSRAPTRTSSSTSSWPRSSRSTTPSSTSSTATRASARSSEGAGLGIAPRRARCSRDAGEAHSPRRARDMPKLGDFPDVLAEAARAARAAPHCLLCPGACARLSELLHAPEERQRPDPAARAACERGPAGSDRGISRRRAPGSRGSRRSG